MKLTLQGNGLEAALGSTQGFSGRRLLSAVATGLTRTASQIKAAEQAEMRDAFDRPTRFTLGSVYSTTADIGKLFADVGIKGQDQGQRAATRWLRWQVSGGLRTPKAFERLLTSSGFLDDDMRAVPGRAAKLDAYGNLSNGQLVQILSQLRIDSTVGSTRSLPRLSKSDTKKDARLKANTIRRAYGRAGGRYVALRKGTRGLLPGIYLNEGRDFGAKVGFGASRRLRPVLIFVSKAYYQPETFDFYRVARTGAERLGAELRRAIDERRASLAARGGR